MEIIKEFIKPELFILIPVIYIIGMGFKKSELIKDKYIPVLLGSVSCFLTLIYVGSTTDTVTFQEIMTGMFIAITQGILIAGASTYVNQIIKQTKKEE